MFNTVKERKYPNFLLKIRKLSGANIRQLGKEQMEQKILSLLESFKSNDPLKRHTAQSDVYQFYINSIELQMFIRRQISYVLYEFIYEREDHCGIAELLQLLQYIYDCDNSLQKEYETHIYKIILPLHKTEGLVKYHALLTEHLVLFLEKDTSRTELTIKRLFTFWPKTGIHKELMFIDEVQRILAIIDPGEFQKVSGIVFRQLSKSVSSESSIVAEKTFSCLENERVTSLIRDNSQNIFPIIIPTLLRNSRTRWNDKIRKSTANLLIQLMDMNQTLFNELKRSIPDEVGENVETSIAGEE